MSGDEDKEVATRDPREILMSELQLASPLDMYNQLISTMQPEHQVAIREAVIAMQEIVHNLNATTDQGIIGTLAGGLFCVSFNTKPLTMDS